MLCCRGLRGCHYRLEFQSRLAPSRWSRIGAADSNMHAMLVVLGLFLGKIVDVYSRCVLSLVFPPSGLRATQRILPFNSRRNLQAD